VTSLNIGRRSVFTSSRHLPAWWIFEQKVATMQWLRERQDGNAVSPEPCYRLSDADATFRNDPVPRFLLVGYRSLSMGSSHFGHRCQKQLEPVEPADSIYGAG
jgi:hypothetical protein